MSIIDEFDKLEMSTTSSEIPESIDKSSYREFRKQQKKKKETFKETQSSFYCESTTEVKFNDSESVSLFLIEEFFKSSDIRCFVNLTRYFHNKMFNEAEFMDILYYNLCLNIKKGDNENGLKYSQLIYLTSETIKNPEFLFLFKNIEKVNLIINESKERYKREVKSLY